MKRFMCFLVVLSCLFFISSCASEQNSSDWENWMKQGVWIDKVTPESASDEAELDGAAIKEAELDGTRYDDELAHGESELWGNERPEYVDAYTEFLLSAHIEQDTVFPIRGYYLFDLNFDDVPELGIFHDSYGSMGGYFTYYYFDGNTVKAILNESGEPASASNFTQLLADFEQKKVYLLKEMYLLIGNDNGTYGYVREIKNEGGIPCVYDVLNLEVDQESDLWSHLVQYNSEDEFLSDPELEECLITECYLEKAWIDISSKEYLKRKRQLIPEENSFVDLRDECPKYLGANYDENDFHIDVRIWKEEIDQLFWQFVQGLE